MIQGRQSENEDGRDHKDVLHAEWDTVLHSLDNEEDRDEMTVHSQSSVGMTCAVSCICSARNDRVQPVITAPTPYSERSDCSRQKLEQMLSLATTLRGVAHRDVLFLILIAVFGVGGRAILASFDRCSFDRSIAIIASHGQLCSVLWRRECTYILHTSREW